MNKHLLTTLIFLVSLAVTSGRCYADLENPLNFRETDGSPDTYPYQVKVSNGTLTDNLDGTITISTGGGSAVSSDITGIIDVSTTNFRVLDEGTTLTANPNVNFIGSGITCADGTNRTDCTLTGGGGVTVFGSPGFLQFISSDGTNLSGDTTLKWYPSSNTLVLSRDGTEVRYSMIVSSDTGALLAAISNDGGAYFDLLQLNNGLSYQEIQNVSTNNRLLGRATAGAGVIEEITLGTNLSLAGTTLNASGSGGITKAGTSGFITFISSDNVNISSDTSLQWNMEKDLLIISRDSGLASSMAIAISSDTGVLLANISHDGSANFTGVSHFPGAGFRSTRIGGNATFGSTNAGNQSVNIGENQSDASGTLNVVIGEGQALNSGTDSIVIIGQGTSNAGAADNSICIGQGLTCNAAASIVIGDGAAISNGAHTSSMIFGAGNASSAANQAIFGGNTAPIMDVFFGKQSQNATPPRTVQIHATEATGTNVAGPDLRIISGKATGNADGGDIMFSIPLQLASGSIVQATMDAVRISTTVDTVTITPPHPSMTGLVISGDTSQTADLMRIENVSNQIFASISFDGSARFSNDSTANLSVDTSINMGQFGVRVTQDGDGSITFTGLGDGADEDYTINFDDTANTIVSTSSTGVTEYRILQAGGSPRASVNTTSASGYSLFALQSPGDDWEIDLGGSTVTDIPHQLGFFNTSQNDAYSLVLSADTAAVNYLKIKNANTNVSPDISALGTDSNISIGITPKGSGVIKTTTGIVSSSATDFGWSVVTGADTACNTTCNHACVFGEDTAVIGTIVACTDATADRCLCAGSN